MRVSGVSKLTLNIESHKTITTIHNRWRVNVWVERNRSVDVMMLGPDLPTERWTGSVPDTVPSRPISTQELCKSVSVLPNKMITSKERP